MLITRMRLSGFKSFVDPTELLVEPGLTGVVGPNGCGKSNLLEALRWVMGETSYKAMRGSAMDDVIFSGTTGRPARNAADVTLFLDNRARTAPAEFNDSDELEVTRRIERDAGSSYRINGREVRARDIRVLFEDAASGARSPALVRQGQIGDIINARPDQRRRILEDAAGIAGLHSRRHDAELRLKAAEANLLRVSDVLGQMQSQMESLKRQARQARRYTELSEEVRRAEAVTQYIRWRDAQHDVETEEAALRDIQAVLSGKLSAEAGLIARSTELAEQLDALRKTEIERAAALTRLTLARDGLDQEISSAESRIRELDDEQQRIAADEERERVQIEEAKHHISELEREQQLLAENPAGEKNAGTERLRATVAALRNSVAERDEEHQRLSRQALQEASARRLAETRLKDRRAEIERARERLHFLEMEARKQSQNAPSSAELGDLERGVAEAESRLRRISSELDSARRIAADSARELAEAQKRETAIHLEVRALETERKTLARMLARSDGTGHPAILNSIVVEQGFETAVGAALGEALDASTDPEAPARWTAMPPDLNAPELPQGALPLAAVVSAPAELHRALSQIGIVESVELGERLHGKLATGQSLVTRAGDIWRWDGFVATASAPSSAAKRLVERNSLADVEAREAEARQQLEAARNDRGKSEGAVENAAAAAGKLEHALKEAAQELRHSQDAANRHRQRLESYEAALAANGDAQMRARQELVALSSAAAELETELSRLPVADLSDAIERAGRARDEARSELGKAERELAVRNRELELRRSRRETVTRELDRWRTRVKSAETQIKSLSARASQVAATLDRLRTIPEAAGKKRLALSDQISAAEASRSQTADVIATAEASAREVATQLRALHGEMSAARERKARVQTHLETARLRRTELAQAIQGTFGVRPEGCLRLAGVEDAGKLPVLAKAEERLAKLRSERERLGGVNLEAVSELDTLQAEFDKLSYDQADIEAAVAKLRAGISKLNREARRRLVASFETVNRHFASLFGTLFGGGEARLELIEHEDPLQGGLEIIARPPGKKPVTLSLLSGGEQTLTALSLIFAVFLTNPSPICVLDEVDAPLDDTNVERFCALMERMSEETDTRFLVITHHPVTMARMNRLFGVTMAERGVSQLVSVDLEAAQRFREAG